MSRPSRKDYRQAPPSGGSCPTCGKRLYVDKASAKRAIRQFEGRQGRLNAYRCGDAWHVGHLGANSREDFR